MNCLLLRIIGLMLVLLLTAGQAQALCVGPPIRHVFVGDTASDPACGFNDLQSAIDDASTNPSCTSVIHVTREHTYTDQHLTISNRNVDLVAWGDGVTCTDVVNLCNFFSCPFPPAATNPLVTLLGHDGDSVIHIDGASNVSLLNLSITGATLSSDQSGGGIYYDGTGSLSLTSTTVNLNHAGYGAGINMNGDGGPASLYLNAYSQILVNTAAVSGGGIRMTGTSRLYALQPHTLIGFNHATNGDGGGIEVIGPARADIGSSGFNGLGVIDGNDAQYGGGIDILTFDDDQHAIVRLFTTDANNPVQITDNFASHTGGAVYLKPLLGLASRADSVLCAYDFRINGNSAPEGAAIYSDADYSPGIVDTQNGGKIALNRNADFFSGDDTPHQYCVQTEAPSALGAVPCAPGVACNEFVGNQAEDSGNQPTDGSTILLQNASALIADRFSARLNTGAHVLRLVADSGGGDGAVFAVLSGCLLVDNVLTQELIAMTDGSEGELSMDSCTVAGNQIGAPFAILAPYTSLYNSIIDQPGRGTVDPSITDGYFAAYVLTNDRSTLPDTAYIHEGEPTFADAANGDYHLVPASLGVDSAPKDTVNNIGYTGTIDLDGNPRIVDLPNVANNFGAMDLGAYEIQLTAVLSCAVADTIFCNGFEVAN